MSGTSFSLQGAVVTNVQEFRYMGQSVQEIETCGKRVKNRIQKYGEMGKGCHSVMCDRERASVVRPALLYILETVTGKRQEA